MSEFLTQSPSLSKGIWPKREARKKRKKITETKLPSACADVEVGAQEHKRLVKFKNTSIVRQMVTIIFWQHQFFISCEKKTHTKKPWQTTLNSAVPRVESQAKIANLRTSGHPRIRERHTVTWHQLWQGTETNQKKVYFGKTQLKEMKCRFGFARPQQPTPWHGTAAPTPQATVTEPAACKQQVFHWRPHFKNANNMLGFEVNSGITSNTFTDSAWNATSPKEGIFETPINTRAVKHLLCWREHLSLDTAPAS